MSHPEEMPGNKVAREQAAEPLLPKDPPRSDPPIWRSTGVVAAVTVVSRVLGLVRDSITARYFGAGGTADAFFLAYRIPNMLRRLVAEGSMATAFIPVFSQSMREDELAGTAQAPGDSRAQRALGEAIGFCLLVTVALSAVGMFFSTEITKAFAPGFTDLDKLTLTSQLLFVMLPYLSLVGVLALTNGVLNTLGVFGLPAAAPAILNVAMISSVFLMYSRLTQPVFALAYGVLIGGFLAILPQWVALYRLGYSLRPRSPFGSSTVGELAKLMIPAILGSSVYQFMVVINSVFASLLDDGTVAWLYYADRIFQFPLGVFSIAVGTAVLPAFSKLAAANDNDGLQNLLERSLGWINFITIPAATGLTVLALPITQLCYQYQRFSFTDSLQTAHALQAYSIGLWALSCHGILARAYLSKRDTKTPAVVACLTLALFAYFSLAFMGPPTAPGDSWYRAVLVQAQAHFGLAALSHAGLALAGSFAAFVSFLALFICLPRVGLAGAVKPMIGSLVRCAVGSAVMAVLLIALLNAVESKLLLVATGVIGGVLVYLAAMVLLKSTEAGELVAFLRSGDTSRFSFRKR